MGSAFLRSRDEERVPRAGGAAASTGTSAGSASSSSFSSSSLLALAREEVRFDLRVELGFLAEARVRLFVLGSCSSSSPSFSSSLATLLSSASSSCVARFLFPRVLILVAQSSPLLQLCNKLIDFVFLLNRNIDFQEKNVMREAISNSKRFRKHSKHYVKMQAKEESDRLTLTWAPRRETLVALVFILLGVYASGLLRFVWGGLTTMDGTIGYYLSQPENWPSVFMRAVVGLLFVGCGLAFSTTEGSRTERCVIDKRTRVVRFESAPLLHARLLFSWWSRHHQPRETTQELDALDAIEIESALTKTTSGTRPCRIRLVFSEGSVALPITQAYHIDRARQMDVAEHIRDFVGMKNVEIDVLGSHDDDEGNKDD